MSSEQRSLLVTAIAFQAAVLSAIGTCVGTVLTGLLFTFFPLEQMRQSAEAAAKASPIVPTFARVLPLYLPSFFVTLTVCSIVSLTVSIGLLRRRPWARFAFILLLTLAIALNIFVLCSLEYSFLVVPSSAEQPIQGLNTLRYGLALVVFIITAGFSLFFAYLIKKLSSKEVCQEFEKTNTQECPRT